MGSLQAIFVYEPQKSLLKLPSTLWWRSMPISSTVSSQGKQSKAAWGAVPRGQWFHWQAIPLALAEHNVLSGGGHGQWLQEEGLGHRHIAFEMDLVPIIPCTTRRELHQFNSPTYCARISNYGLAQCCVRGRAVAKCIACVIYTYVTIVQPISRMWGSMW